MILNFYGKLLDSAKAIQNGGEFFFSWKLFSGGIRLLYAEPCLLVNGKFWKAAS